VGIELQVAVALAGVADDARHVDVVGLATLDEAAGY
jgi:hypothetical protein